MKQQKGRAACGAIRVCCPFMSLCLSRRMRFHRFAAASLWLCATASFAQNVSLLAGQLQVPDKDESSFAAALSYAHPAGDYAALSLTYLNEGHPLDHHRDGVSGQLWLRSMQRPRGLSFGVGVGPYYYFDTARTAAAGYRNDHGWAPMYSVQANWHFGNHWFAQVQANRVVPRGKDATTQVLVGAGFRFDGVPGNKLHLNGPSSDDTLTLSGGQTIVNSFNSERARASSVEYRRAAGPYVDWTVTWLKEGAAPATRRSGVAGQVWLIRSLSTHVELGMGAGPYLAYDLPVLAAERQRLAGLVSIVGRYHFDRRWVGQLSWNRVVTSYHHDADVLLLGVGAAF
ncbi:hypothetical protein [Janthinobacterium fluminis]|uniref:Lipid A deacylase LpxR family protein n=1 Tax=Janthinobacterium fluminis TaxID=2987524 RepID=A0ABT5K8V0_9BURK|nr:hypothetical protein [Janthinobacterium fluminis]MDC8760526.1 hypothetical protein [Janthinobacterium fluminis]